MNDTSNFIGLLLLMGFMFLMGFSSGNDYRKKIIAKEKVFVYDMSKYQCKMINTLKEK